MIRPFLFIVFSAALTACTATPENETQMSEPEKRAYMVITADLHDRDAFIAGYAKATGPLVARFGGRYVAMAPGAKLLEGEWGDGASIVISEWPNRDAIETFWNSPEYAEAKALREGIADVQVLVIETDKFTAD